MKKWLLIIPAALMWSHAAMAVPEALPPGAKIQGHFVEDKTMPGFTTPLHSEGEFIIAPARGVIWRNDKTFATTMIITPAGIAQDVDGERTMSMAANRIPVMSHLYTVIGGIMAGDRHALDADFIITESGDAAHWRLHATPRQQVGPAMPFTAIDVSGGRLVDHVILTRAEGGSDQLTFIKQCVSSTPLSARDDAAFKSIIP